MCSSPSERTIRESPVSFALRWIYALQPTRKVLKSLQTVFVRKYCLLSVKYKVLQLMTCQPMAWLMIILKEFMHEEGLAIGGINCTLNAAVEKIDIGK